MREIERQATQAWSSGRPATAAYDFLRIEIPSGDQQGQPQQTRHWQEGPHAHNARRNRHQDGATHERHAVRRKAKETMSTSDDDEHRPSTSTNHADPNEGPTNATTRPDNKRRKSRH